MRKSLIGSVIVLLLVSLLLSCAPKASPTETAVPPAQKTSAPTKPPAGAAWDKIVQDAKKEGTVTVYAAWIRTEASQAITDSMNKIYGIKVEWLMGRGATQNEKVRMEQQTKNYECDILAGGHTVGIIQMQWGFADSIPPLPAEENAKWRVHPYIFDREQKRFLMLEIYPGGIIVNSKLVKPEEEPRSWNDILEPKWKGKMVMDDPRISGPASLWLTSAIKESALGKEYMKKLAAQEPLLLKGAYREIVDQIAKGSKLICPVGPTVSAVEAIRAGATMKILVPKEGTGTIGNGMTLMKNAPHHNASLVLINWLLTTEGQTALSKGQGSPALRTDVPQDWIFEAIRLVDVEKLWIPTREDLEKQEATYEIARQIFGKD